MLVVGQQDYKASKLASTFAFQVKVALASFHAEAEAHADEESAETESQQVKPPASDAC